MKQKQATLWGILFICQKKKKRGKTEGQCNFQTQASSSKGSALSHQLEAYLNKMRVLGKRDDDFSKYMWMILVKVAKNKLEVLTAVANFVEFMNKFWYCWWLWYWQGELETALFKNSLAAGLQTSRTAFSRSCPGSVEDLIDDECHVPDDVRLMSFLTVSTQDSLLVLYIIKVLLVPLRALVQEFMHIMKCNKC